MTQHQKTFGIKFDWTFNLGHIVTAVSILIGGTSFAVTNIIRQASLEDKVAFMSSRLNNMDDSLKKLAEISSNNIEHRVEILNIKRRLDVLEVKVK
jgi:hypothetical protein